MRQRMVGPDSTWDTEYEWQFGSAGDGWDWPSGKVATADARVWLVTVR